MKRFGFSSFNLRFLSGKAFRLFLIFSFLFLTGLPAFAQFTITDDFRNQGSADIIIGDQAYFTSGVDDPVGAGWLRITRAQNYQQGYAFINRSFPSTLGLLIDFEYKMWRSSGNVNAGADGMSFFLFDGNIDQANFRLGGYGGSLGYARNTNASPSVDNGLLGGYIGVGLDAYGNFSNATEGRNDGNGMQPNAITIRGATVESTPASSNPYLIQKLLGDRTESVDEIRGRDEIDYNTITPTRPTDAQFYRRVQMEIIPTTSGTYRIVVRWRKTLTGNFTEEISYISSETPPSLLKLGFAASTGAQNNFHEIRNLLITTPNNLRVTKRANKDILRIVEAGTNANQITYTIEVVNDTDQPYTNASFLDELLDINGNPIPTSMFSIGTINHSGFTDINITPVSGQNRIEGNLTIAPHTTGTITVTGTLSAIPPFNSLTNRVTVLPTGDDVDFDLGNNTAIVNTPVIAENVDMVISKTTDEACLDPVNGNTFTITATNMGILPAQYGGVAISESGTTRSYTRNRLEVTEIVPPGVSVMSSSIPSGWQLVATQPNTPSPGYTSYVYRTAYTQPATNGSNITNTPNNNSLTSGISLPSFTYTLVGTSGYTNQTRVRYVQEQGNVNRTGNGFWWSPYNWTFNDPTSVSELEPVENRNNNTASASVNPIPTAPTVPSSTIYYCLGETAAQLTATATPGNTLTWYLNLGGTPAAVAPTPFTNTAGTTQYYVSQTNGNCESPWATIDVVVLPTPTAGSIAGDQTICSSTAAAEITSTSPGTAPDWPTGTTLSYRWESSADGTTGWTVVPDQTGLTYTPGTLTATNYYRRITIATLGDKSCESSPTTAVVKTVNTVDAGSISGSQTICRETVPTMISSPTDGTGAGIVTYRWEQSADGTTGWTPLPGATGSSYAPGALTTTTYYRRITISALNDVLCEAFSAEVVVTVKECKLITNPMLRSRTRNQP